MSDKWYYNVETGDVQQGKQASWDNRMGPYDTEEEARQALTTAAERNKSADKQEEADDNWGKPPAWEK
ncbi:MAG: hypothetical protein SPK00_04900 [Corynebacterium glucuronolyticum]|nr:hypothetical protein [Corynebacterium glucuronolyticum]MDD7586900.1 hypothetical protein [Mycobacteriaceae bacterium]MDY5834074.1 hypothetical protein [Corynebacterium glucuronolyticum]